MLYILVGFAVLLLVFGPQLWVRYVLWRHSRTIEQMPGTGGELAEHLIERFELDGVKVVRVGKGQNYYSPDEKVVGLSPDVHDARSLTAVAVAAHEVGHAIQFCRQDPVSKLRERYLRAARIVERFGNALLWFVALMTFVVKAPQMLYLAGIIGVGTMLVTVLMYVAILPEEFDASFNKALPILEQGYVPEAKLPAIRQVLRACALTYVAAALVNVLNLWRWFRVLR